MGDGLPPPIPLDNGHALSIVVVAVIFPIVATLSVLGRVAARRVQRMKLGADDYVVMGALVAVYGQMVIIIMSTVYGGVGHHIDELSKENLVIFFKLITAVQFTFGTSLGLAKISICFLLIRIFSLRTFRIAAWIVMIYSTCWMIMVISIGAGLCRPFAYNWDKTIKGGKCGDLDPAYISIAALDILGDSMIIALPMPWVWKLRISAWSKIGLSIVFALGFLDIVIAILRIVYLVNTSFAPTADFTWSSTGTYLWSVIEPSMAVIVACAGLLRPLLVAYFPSLPSFFSKSSTSNSNGNTSFATTTFGGTNKRGRFSRKKRGDLDTFATLDGEGDYYVEGDTGSEYPLEPTKTQGAHVAAVGEGFVRPGAEEFSNYQGTVTAGYGGGTGNHVGLNPKTINVENSFEIVTSKR